ncbi:olfactory receptor 1J1 [Hydra vulgaris]|uniref:Olfactory receptor 1J1 n=1 Tax=Hydra vulgaris TaxID=6087 RepID=A0ABM4BES9_HYDVU
MLSHWEVIFKSVFYSFFFVCGLIGNILVILFFGFKMKKSAQFRLFVVYLAIADCFYAVVSPIHLIYLLVTNNKWTVGKELCKILSVSGPLTVNVSAWILCLMGYERYRAICHPFARRFTKKMIHISVGLIWIACIGLKMLTFIRTNVTNNECYPHFDGLAEQTINAGVSLLAESILPIIVLSYYLVRVTITMKKRSKLFQTNDDNSICLRKDSCNNSSNSLITHENHSVINDNKISNSKKNNSSNFLQVASSTNNNLLKNDINCFSEIEMNDLNIKPPLKISKKKNTLMLWNFIRRKNPVIKLVITSSASKKNSSNKADREIIIVFFLAVLMFVITTFPFTLNYFIACYLLSYSFSDEQVLKYGPTMEKTSDWLAFLVLSGCLSNVIIYSGKFPDFRYQIYKWANNILVKICSKVDFRKKNNEVLESSL